MLRLCLLALPVASALTVAPMRATMVRNSRSAAPVSQAFDGATAAAYETIFESLAPCWEKHAALVSKYAGAGELSVLDIGSGPGEPSCTLAATFPTAKITCTDVAPDMNDKAAARAERKGVKLASIEAVGGDDLSQFADASFDFVTMNFVLMFVPDRAKCLEECKRVLRPGGKLLSTCWKTQSFMACIGTAMEEFTGEPPSAPPPVNPMALKAENAQEDLAKAAGLGVVSSEVENVEIVADNEEIFRACSLIVMGPKLKEMEEEGRAGATKDFQDAFVKVAPKVEGIEINDGAYKIGGLYQMLVMSKD